MYLLRHAKSSWEDISLEDYERPLLNKGIKRAKNVASHLLERGDRPELIISSHAVRAYETARIFAKKLNYPEKEIVIDENLYFSGSEAMENLVYSVSDKIERLMLVGHNPDMTNFANIFLSNKLDYIPTSGLVCITFETDKWQEIMVAKRDIPFVIIPKKR